VTVTATELSKAIGRQVVLAAPDTVKVRFGPLLVPATLGIANGHLLTVSEVGVRLLDIDLAAIPIVPPCVMHLAVADGSASLACSVAPVPASLIEAISANS